MHSSNGLRTGNNKPLQISTDERQDGRRTTERCLSIDCCSDLEEKSDPSSTRGMEKTITEEPKIAKEVRLVEQSPVNSAGRGIERSLIDIPTDRSSRWTIARTEREESHLARGIDQL